MYYKDRQIIENFRIKANNCYVELDKYSLSSVKEYVLNPYICNSALKNIVLEEVDNIERLIDFLKRILLYQSKIIEKDQERFQKEERVDLLETEIANLIPQLVAEESSTMMINTSLSNSVKSTIEMKTKEKNNLLQEIDSLKIIVENMKSAFTSYQVPDLTTDVGRNLGGYGILEVDLTILDDCKRFIKYISNKFKSEAYDVYINSDLTEYFEGYAHQTDTGYRKVIECFRRLYIALDNYINDLVIIERSLTKQSGTGMIHNSDVATLLLNLESLEEFNISFSNIMDKANNILENEKEYNMSKDNKANKNIELDNQIMASGGLGRREAVARAATYLSEKENVPFFFGGKSNTKGFNKDWGTEQKVFIEGSKDQPNGSYHPYGLDSSGFIAWALTNGGYSINDANENAVTPLGEARKYTKKNLSNHNVKAGDLLYKVGENVAIITEIDHKNNKIKVALEKDAQTGMNVISSKIDEFFANNKYDQIILMEKYYADKDNMTNGGVYES